MFCNFIKKKLQYRCFPVKFVKLLRISISKNICKRLLAYFHYDYLHHFHYHHFHCNCKMHLYCLRILLTNLVDCNMILCLFQLNFAYFFRHIIFSSFIPSFLFFTRSKRTQNSFTTTGQISDVLFILYLKLFTLPYLYLIAYTYLHLLFILMFSL